LHIAPRPGLLEGSSTGPQRAGPHPPLTERESEMTTETVETVETVDPMSLVSESIRRLVEVSRNTWEAEVTEANLIANKLRTAGNALALIHEVRDSADTDDQFILNYRQWKEDTDNKILANQAAVEKHIVEQGLVNVEPIDEDALRKQYLAKALQLKNLRTSISAFIDAEHRETVLNSWTNLVTAPGTRASNGDGTGKGSGVEKARIQSINVDGTDVFVSTTTDGEEVRKTSLTILALWLSKDSGTKVDGSVIREAAYAAAGVTKLADLNGQPVEFSLNVGEKTYRNITVVPAVSK
jgi:hypothetical protein